jgi:hypothetical protein
MLSALLLSATMMAEPISLGAKAPEPIAVIQFQPVEVLEKGVYSFVRSLPIANPEPLAQELEEMRKRALSEKGWDGLNTKKPGTGYVVYDDEKLEKSFGFLVFPVTDEKTFLDLLVRCGKARGEWDAIQSVKDVPGVYDIKGQTLIMPCRVRVVNGHAYVGINAPIEMYAVDKLIPTEKTYNPKETGSFALTVRVDKLPKARIEYILRGLEKKAAEGKESFANPASAAGAALFDQLFAYVRKNAASVIKDGDTFGVRVRGDQLDFDFFVKGRSGSKLAADIAARKPLTNQFSGLITDQAVAGFAFKYPLLSEELQQISSKAITDMYREVSEKQPGVFKKPILEQLFTRLSRTAQSGQADVAFALHGPNAKGTYTFVAGIALDDAVGMTTELRKLIDQNAEGIVEWDADEEVGVKIHKANLVPLLPLETKKILGGNSTCHFALTKSGVILALGRESLAEVKRGIGLKTVPSPLIDFQMNFVKARKVVEFVNPEVAEEAFSFLAQSDRLVQLLHVDVAGGEELRVTVNGKGMIVAITALGKSAEPTGSQPK